MTHFSGRFFCLSPCTQSRSNLSSPSWHSKEILFFGLFSPCRRFLHFNQKRLAPTEGEMKQLLYNSPMCTIHLLFSVGSSIIIIIHNRVFNLIGVPYIELIRQLVFLRLWRRHSKRRKKARARDGRKKAWRQTLYSKFNAKSR